MSSTAFQIFHPRAFTFEKSNCTRILSSYCIPVIAHKYTKFDTLKTFLYFIQNFELGPFTFFIDWVMLPQKLIAFASRDGEQISGSTFTAIKEREPKFERNVSIIKYFVCMYALQFGNEESSKLYFFSNIRSFSPITV